MREQTNATDSRESSFSVNNTDQASIERRRRLVKIALEGNERALEHTTKDQLQRICEVFGVEFNTYDSAAELRSSIVEAAGKTPLDGGGELDSAEDPDSVVRLAVALSLADGEFSPAEVEEVYKSAELELSGLSPRSREELDEVVSVLRDGDIDTNLTVEQLKKTLSPAEIDGLVDYLFDVAVADGIFHAQEEEFLRSIHSLMGSDKERFERQLRLCKAIAGVEVELSNKLDSASDANVRSVSNRSSRVKPESSEDATKECSRSKLDKQFEKADAEQFKITNGLERRDAILMLHPPSKVQGTLRRMGVQTVGELLDLDIASSRLSPRGKKAKAIAKLKEQAQDRLVQNESSQDEAGHDAAPRNIDTLFSLLHGGAK